MTSADSDNKTLSGSNDGELLKLFAGSSPGEKRHITRFLTAPTKNIVFCFRLSRNVSNAVRRLFLPSVPNCAISVWGSSSGGLSLSE